MIPEKIKNATICVVGLGYVGFPLAEAFSRFFPTIGFDINTSRIEEITQTDSKVKVTSDPAAIKQADYIMICVPTPVKKNKQPDLVYVKSAASVVGQNLKKGATVVLESTVYPGVTEWILKPVLEERSGMICGKEFRIGYSPERINPGDDIHVLSRITKIVSGMDSETLDDLTDLYSQITTVYRAKDIQTAEAAKVIENIQRDLNIALMNELSIIFHRLGLDTKDVLDAAKTKWNFMPFMPGLVGGHCIPVDPYYLVARAQEAGYHPQVILAGRAINDSMPAFVAMMAIEGLNKVSKVIRGSRVLIMGLTYKEDVPDIRESPVNELVQELKKFGIEVYGYDPLLKDDIIEKFGAIPFHDRTNKMDAVIIAVAHTQFRQMDTEAILSYMNKDPVLIDVRGIIKREEVERHDINYYCL
jgi:UDPglucose 6-dehydrogenase/UDP-N-acetyl-D-galactosamine dehydrogenase